MLGQFLYTRGWQANKINLFFNLLLLIFGLPSLTLLSNTKISIHPLAVILMIVIGICARRFPSLITKAWKNRKGPIGKPHYPNDWAALPDVIFSGYFISAFVNGLLEELAFRGTILGHLLESIPLSYAVAVSALLFAVWHIISVVAARVEIYNFDIKYYRKAYFNQVLWHFWAGIIYATIFLVAGNIWIAWLTHFLSNLYGRMNQVRYRAIVLLIEHGKDGIKDPGMVDPETICSICLENNFYTWFLKSVVQSDDGSFKFEQTTNPHEGLETSFKEAYWLAQIIQKTLPYEIPVIVG